MDESFQLRAKRLLAGERRAALDFSMLTACLSAQQAASPAARAQAIAPAGGTAAAAGTDPIEEILLCGPGWRQAASAQSGCFNRAEVRRRNKGS
jgi:hypothetical protein